MSCHQDCQRHLATGKIKASVACYGGQRGNLLGRDLVPVVSVPGSSLWALRSKGGLLHREMGLALMESAKAAGTARGV